MSGMDEAGCVAAPGGEAYERLGTLYDAWCESVDEDIAFYLAACAGAEGPIVELGVGSGRTARPLRLAGHPGRGRDASPSMLERARERARAHGVEERLELHLGDLREPPPLGP